MKDENIMRFGTYMKKKRQADPREVTQGDIAKLLGVSLSLISEIEACRRKPLDAKALEKFCEYLDLDAEEKARLYDLAAQEKNAVPADIEEVFMYERIGELARFALRESKAGNITEEDWKRFIRESEAKKEGST